MLALPLGVSLLPPLGALPSPEIDATVVAGVTLAAPVSGVRQVQGTLVVRIDRPADRVAPHLEIPLRFALAGRVTVPEARARVALEELPRAVAPARALVVVR